MRPKTKTRVTPPPAVGVAAAAPLHPWLAALARSPWLYVVVSALLLAPCYWQPRVEAGDLSSHIYNSWLSQLIESGHLQGLAVVGQTTNILFDLMLGGLFKLLGAEAAQRISVSLAVLVFIWGAFAYGKVVAGRAPWQILPCIAMLGYGWVYHMGFFDFYLSLGLCFWAMALLWIPTAKRIAGAVPILILAYFSHALPVAWAVGLLVYVVVARRVSAQARVYVIGGSLSALLLLHVVIGGTMVTQWSASQISLASGVDQVWVFDGKYYGVMVGLLIVWASMFLHLLRGAGPRAVVSGVPFQLCIVSAAAVFILPTSVLIPGFHHALAFIAERMSLGVAICICGLLATVRLRRVEQIAMTVVTLLFFFFLFHDERALNSFEDRMQNTVAALPPGQRVISAIDDGSLRVNALVHIVDRVCIHHCYSYANYEPSTAQFRVRAVAENPYVAYTYQDSWLMQVGMYVVKERDLPLYQVDMEGDGMVLKSLPAGAPTGRTTIQVLGDIL